MWVQTEVQSEGVEVAGLAQLTAEKAAHAVHQAEQTGAHGQRMQVEVARPRQAESKLWLDAVAVGTQTEAELVKLHVASVA